MSLPHIFGRPPAVPNDTDRTREPDGGSPRRTPHQSPPWRIWPMLVASLIFAGLFFGPGLVSSARTEDIPYSAFLSDVHHHEVSSVEVSSSGQTSGTLSDGRAFATQAPPWTLTTRDLSSRLENAGVKVTAYQQSDTLAQLVGSLLPTLLFMGAIIWLSRRAQRTLSSGGLGGLTGLGGLRRTNSRVTDAERPSTRFNDIAGYDGVKEEVREVVDYLQHPHRYQQAGARGPRGVLLVGPSGTGKTMLARAVAGEAQVPFYAVTGSSFVEMFVGLGASRVRELFAEARRNGPAIVFIDEIDAIGGRRGSSGLTGHDEREQTLNQLLAEMDGFTQTSSVVVLANTNRPEILDPALLRPGRFDRQVQVPLPGLADREKILAVHTRHKKLSLAVDLHALALATPGFSGADLANLVNEAALRAARADRTDLLASDFDDARERLILGRRDHNALLPEEKLRVSVHEAGHALVAALCPTADPVAKVTILPAGMSLGATHQLPIEERRLYTEQHLLESLRVRVAGRAAELTFFGQASTGAADDLQSATALAVRMVREFGLSPRLGPVAYPATPTRADDDERPYAEETQRLIDNEVTRLLREAERHADELLTQHRAALDRLTQRLLADETVDGHVVYELLPTEPTRAA